MTVGTKVECSTLPHEGLPQWFGASRAFYARHYDGTPGEDEKAHNLQQLGRRCMFVEPAGHKEKPEADGTTQVEPSETAIDVLTYGLGHGTATRIY